MQALDQAAMILPAKSEYKIMPTATAETVVLISRSPHGLTATPLDLSKLAELSIVENADSVAIFEPRSGFRTLFKDRGCAESVLQGLHRYQAEKGNREKNRRASAKARPKNYNSEFAMACIALSALMFISALVFWR